MKFMWKALVAFGCLLVLGSFGMETTVGSGAGRVYNLGLQAQQQMLLILGCFLFLAGVVLFAVLKVRQTPEQQAREEEARRLSMEATKGKLVTLGSAQADRADKVLSKVRAGTDNLPGRLCAGVAVGLLWCVYGGQLAGSQGFGAVLFCGAMVFSLWPHPWRPVITRLAMANMAFLVIAFGVLYFTRDLSFSEEAVRGVVLMLGLPILLSVALIVFLRRKLA